MAKIIRRLAGNPDRVDEDELCDFLPLLPQPLCDLATERTRRRECAHEIRAPGLAFADRRDIERDPLLESHRRIARAPDERVADADDLALGLERFRQAVIGTQRPAGGCDDEQGRQSAASLSQSDGDCRLSRYCRFTTLEAFHVGGEIAKRRVLVDRMIAELLPVETEGRTKAMDH